MTVRLYSRIANPPRGTYSPRLLVTAGAIIVSACGSALAALDAERQRAATRPRALACSCAACSRWPRADRLSASARSASAT